jgi:hypothetical protein
MPDHGPDCCTAAIFLRNFRKVRHEIDKFRSFAAETALQGAILWLKKTGRIQGMRPELREETPVTRQREDQPLSERENGAKVDRGTIRNAALRDQKTGPRNKLADK